MREPFNKFITNELKDGFLLITCGLPGTAKSGVAEITRRIKGGEVLSTDVLRREVLKNHDIFDNKVAADMQKRTQVYDEMFARADQALKKEKNVILDATFITRALRKRAADIAAKNNVAFIIAGTKCPEATAIRRIVVREKGSDVSNALTEEAYRDNQRRFESVDVDALKTAFPKLNIVYLLVDTSQYAPEEWRVIKHIVR
jgi:predicted kinase